VKDHVVDVINGRVVLEELVLGEVGKRGERMPIRWTCEKPTSAPPGETQLQVLVRGDVKRIV
jgi:hypothetical protein